MKHLVLFILLLSICISINAQSVGINADGSDPEGSAMLDVKSTNRGLLIPRMTSSQIAQIQSPAFGLLVFQTDATTGLYYNAGSSVSPIWKHLLTEVSAADGSETEVNAGTLISVTGSGTQASPYVIAYTGNNLALGETSATAYRGDRGKSAYDHSQLTSGAVHGSSTVGGNLLRLSNPSAIRFLRINADNSVSALTDAEFRTALGVGTGTGTVTSIATGNGITGGTITSSGTLGLTGQALAVHNLATNGMIVRTGSGTVAGRSIATSGNGISISNGNGVSGNPTLSLNIGSGSTQVAAGNHTHSEYDIPAGVINQYAGSSAPSGYLLCQGQAVSRTTYASLFSAIGVTYGSGDGSTTFNLPNLQGYIPVGRNSSDTAFDALGETGGAKTNTLTEAQLPSHTHGVGTLATNSTGAHTHSIDPPSTTTSENGEHRHTVDDRYNSSEYSDDANDRVVGSDSVTSRTVNSSYAGDHTHTLDIAAFASASDGAHSHTISGSTASVGSGTAINNLQPYIVLNYIIKY